MQKMTIETGFKNIGKLFADRVLNYPHHPLFEAVVTYFLINLSDLLEFSQAMGNRVDFKDNIELTSYITDATSLIKHCRNAACHLDSKRNLLDQGYAAFNVIEGNKHTLSIEGINLAGEFPDDVAIFFGRTRLYEGRHLMRALRSAYEFHASHMPDRHDEWADWLGIQQMPACSAP